MTTRGQRAGIAACTVLLASACARPPPAPIASERPRAEPAIEQSQEAPAFAAAAQVWMQRSPDSVERAELLAHALAPATARTCLLRAAYVANTVTIAWEPHGAMQVWIAGDRGWDTVARCADPERRKPEVRAQFAAGRVVDGNAVLQQLDGGAVWVGISGATEPASPPHRAQPPAPPSNPPTAAVAWLRMDRALVDERIGWPAAIDVWFVPATPGWHVALRFEPNEDIAWLVRDRARELAAALVERLPATASLHVAPSGVTTDIEGLLSDDGLAEAWTILLEVGRTGRLPPVHPDILQTSSTSYVVRISDIQRWREFDWNDVTLTSYRHGVGIRDGTRWLNTVQRSPLPRLGLLNATVIEKINGVDVRAPGDIEAAVFAAIEQGLPAIELEVRRGRARSTLRYELIP